MDKQKYGFTELREDVHELRRQAKFEEEERVRNLTVRMLDRLGIAGYSEPGYGWVRIKDFEVRCERYYDKYVWRGRPLGSGGYIEEEAFGAWVFHIPRMKQARDALITVADACTGRSQDMETKEDRVRRMGHHD